MNDHFIFARIVQQFLSDVRQQQRLSPQQASSCQNILNCHTQKLGGLDYVCDGCARHYPQYHSCRHRHCPQCQQQASAHWVAQRQADILPLTYFHLVFTLPHELNGWAQLHPEVIYHGLFQCVWATLSDYSQRNKQLQGQLGMTAVLHTWGQNLNQHVHLHCLIPGGVINNKSDFTVSRREYLYPHRALAKIFRGKMVSALRKAWTEGKLHRITRANEINDTLNTLMQKDWVIHTKPHVRKPETVIGYLARYTYRTAISLSRIVAMDESSVSFKWKDYRDNQQKMMTLEGGEFLRRFLLHILPKGFMRIRHYGYLANRVRVEQLKKIRGWIDSEKPVSGQAAQGIMLMAAQACIPMPCPSCKTGVLHLRCLIPSEKERRRSAIV
ncbi:MAG: IS91 family transposase [Spirochaetales bacterium]|jgi:hypothetical protein|nr:IS91 family transposase [Spirochaetales bacterium]